MSLVRIESFGPSRTWFRPGEPIEVVFSLAVDAPVRVEAIVTAFDLDRPVAQARAWVAAGGVPFEQFLTLHLPDDPRHGYGLRLQVEGAGRSTVASSAVEVLQDRWQSPRHAAITDYGEPAAAAEASAALADWHVNVMQHYDWMWRHYRYRPPDGSDEFRDALGRAVSHKALRRSIEGGHEAGIASLAYGSVYGAEPEYMAEHPDEGVFDRDGQPLSLGGAFFINDIRPGRPWRERLLGEYRDALQAFAFDGIHMDTYGPPYAGVSADGATLDFAALYPGLVAEAAEVARTVSAGRRVLFNCVDGFALESIAAAPAAALYLELWPRDGSLTAVVRWIERARALADGRQVVVAAYAATLKDLGAVTGRAAAFEAVPLLGAVIAAAGAYHHTLAEGDRLLVEGYYPAAVPMEPSEVHELRALWRFTARYVHFLTDPDLVVGSADDLDLRDRHAEPVPTSADPDAGAVWVRQVKSASGRRILHLVDLRDQPDARWTEPKRPAGVSGGLRLRWDVESAVAATPWHADGDAIELERAADAWLLPHFRRWLMLVSS